MSSQNPPPRSRRRIAGERKVPRPVPDAVATDGTVDDATEDASDARTRPAGLAVGEETRRDHAAASTTVTGPMTSRKPTMPKRFAAPRVSRPRGDAPARAVPLRVTVGLAVLALVLVALAAGPFMDGMGLAAYRDVREQSQVAQARRTAPAVAERAAQAILAYDYRSLKADRNAAARFMTPKYRKQYLDTFDGLVLDQATEVKARVQADVRASGVALADPDRVQVLLFVNQTTTSTANDGEPQTALNRVMFDMVRDGETWRVDGITSY